MTIQKFLEDWLCEQNSGIKARTRFRYGEIIRNNIAPLLGGIELEQLTVRTVRELLQELRVVQSDNSILQIMGLLKRALNYAVEQDMINVNPALNITLQRRQRKVEPFNEREQRIIEKHILAQQNPYYYGILVALYTGVRIGELLALTWEDVDIKSRVITVCKTAGAIKVADTENPYISTPKTAAGMRTIPYPKQRDKYRLKCL